jgi:hypothetical protein
MSCSVYLRKALFRTAAILVLVQTRRSLTITTIQAQMVVIPANLHAYKPLNLGPSSEAVISKLTLEIIMVLDPVSWLSKSSKGQLRHVVVNMANQLLA